MSRSNRGAEVFEHKVIFGEGFPVGVSVPGCFLKKVSVDKKYFGETPYHSVKIHFLHEASGKWISKILPNRPREAFRNEEDFNKNKLYIASCLENLMACYLSGNHIKHIMFQTEKGGLEQKVQEINEAIVKKKFWEVEICLKTLPNNFGGTQLAKFPPFMSKVHGSPWKLRYSAWEINNVLAKS